MTETTSEAIGRLHTVKDVALAVKGRISRHHAPIFAAAVAFFAFFALIPALTATIGIYGLVADADDVTEQLTDALDGAPESTREFLVEQMADIASGSSGALGVSVVIGLLIALFSASGAVANLVKSLNVAYEIDENRKPWKLRGVALGLMVGGVLVLCIVMFLMTALPSVLSAVGLDGAGRMLLNIGRYPLLGLVMAGALSMLYRLGPDHRGNDKPLSPRLFTIGGFVATVLFVALSALFSFYTANLGSYGETYGPLATIIVLLLWFQLSALAIIVGAEVDAELADREWRARTGLENPDAKASTGTVAAEAYYQAMAARDREAMMALWHRRGAQQHPLFGELAVPEQLASHLDTLFAAFPDLEARIGDIRGGDESATVRYRLTGTFTGDDWTGIPANESELDLDVVAFVQIDDGFIVAIDEVFDSAAMTAQLGFRPGDDSASAKLKKGFGQLRRRFRRPATPSEIEAAEPHDV